GDWDDILASVANYLGRHGWRAGAPVAVPGEKPTGASEPSNALRLTTTAGALRADGFEFAADVGDAADADVFAFERSAESSEYWVGFNNFYVITRYNRSTKYALAVLQLAEAVRDAYRAAMEASR
ncbi:MAG TPA: lytic murein transglycosylase, partial [Gammaproteobacteria bacterium]|nr:lytic murein transglycosylase [Gammaproteobacteria bacterium]